jgi:cyclin A
MEREVAPDPLCLANHSAQHGDDFIDASMRAIVLSWLIEVASEFGLHQETLFLAGALLDRFLSASKVQHCSPPPSPSPL